MYDLMSINKPTGKNPGAGGGLKSVVYALLVDDIDTWPDRETDLVTILTDVTLKAGKYIHEIYATSQTIEPVEKKLAGENKDSGGVQIDVKFFHPGLDAAIQEFKAKHSTSEFILFIRNCAEDKIYVIGEPCNPAWMEEWEATWGKSVEEGKGSTFTFVSKQSLPMAIYAGTGFDALIYEASGSTSV